MGHNGSGKSTFAKHLNAHFAAIGRRRLYRQYGHPATKACCWLSGQDAEWYSRTPTTSWWPLSSMRMWLCPRKYGTSPRGDTAQGRCLPGNRGHDRVPRPAPPHMLSGGQKQRIAIAGVLAMEPSILVMDEPTAMLDPSGRREVMSAVLKLNRGKRHHRRPYNPSYGRSSHGPEGNRHEPGQGGFGGHAKKRYFQRLMRLNPCPSCLPRRLELLWRLDKKGYSLPLEQAVGIRVRRHLEAFLKAKD